MDVCILRKMQFAKLMYEYVNMLKYTYIYKCMYFMCFCDCVYMVHVSLCVGACMCSQIERGKEEGERENLFLFVVHSSVL
jgi:hypothetical protein